MDAPRISRKTTESILIHQGDLNFGTVQQFHIELLRHLHTNSQVRLDLQELGALDLAGLQVLYAALASAQKQGSRFTIQAGSQAERLDRLCDFSGLPRLPLERPSPKEAEHDL